MRRVVIQLIIGAVLTAMVLPAEADIFGRGFGGAMGGAMLGSLVGGKKGAKKGAIIGGAIGVIRGADESARQQAQVEAYQRQAAERQQIAQQQQQAEIERLKAQQAARAAAPSYTSPSPAGADATLVVEIQKSLIRLGYNPGGVTGQLSAATVEAIKQYQAKQGLLEDGHASQPLLTHLLQHGG